MLDEMTAARFWARVDMSAGPEGCWYWQGRNGLVYWPTTILWNGRLYATHRLAYILTYGEVPAGLVVRHRRANGGCLNSQAHHLLGTRAENNLDRWAHERAGIPRGVLHTYDSELCASGHTQPFLSQA